MNRLRQLLLLPAMLAGCITDEAADPEPELVSVVSVAGTANVLSAIVTVEVGAADSLAVRYGLTASTSPGQLTPAQPVIDTQLDLPVLGLEPETTYRLELVAWRGRVSRVHDAGSVTTGRIPDDLPRYEAGGDNPTPGFIVFAAGSYGLAIDNSGRVVWYHKFAHGPGLNFMPQPNGRYVARPSTPDPTDQEAWVEVDPAGRVTRRLPCAGGLSPRPHDMLALPDQSYWLLCDDVRTLDLRALGGRDDALVTGTTVQHMSARGEMLFEWTPFGNFELADAGPTALAAANVNWTHGNALDLAADGTLVVSFRNLNEVTGIDTRSGLVKWRLGGARNDFAFEGLTPPPFLGQHGLRLTGGELQLLDNLGEPGESRVERYRLDLGAKTATLVRTFHPSPPVVGQLGGNTQALANGHTLVSYGNGGQVEEYDSAGRVVWRIKGPSGFVFRAQRIQSLYTPGVHDR